MLYQVLHQQLVWFSQDIEHHRHSLFCQFVYEYIFNYDYSRWMLLYYYFVHIVCKQHSLTLRVPGLFARNSCCSVSLSLEQILQSWDRKMESTHTYCLYLSWYNCFFISVDCQWNVQVNGQWPPQLSDILQHFAVASSCVLYRRSCIDHLLRCPTSAITTNTPYIYIYTLCNCQR